MAMVDIIKKHKPFIKKMVKKVLMAKEAERMLCRDLGIKTDIDVLESYAEKRRKVEIAYDYVSK